MVKSSDEFEMSIFRCIAARGRRLFVLMSVPCQLSRRRLGFFFTCGCVGSVLQAEVCYNVFTYTLTIHTGPSTSDSRQTTNYFLHNIHNSLTNHNSWCPMALPGVLGCGRGALGWACQSMLCSLPSPLLSLGSTSSLFPFHAPNTNLGRPHGQPR